MQTQRQHLAGNRTVRSRLALPWAPRSAPNEPQTATVDSLNARHSAARETPSGHVEFAFRSLQEQRADERWEAGGYLALMLCGLIAIGICVLSVR